ncbi:hypothetical protein CXB51_018317 [Gossypium anomalum]|uniref:Uncharacterized protein n=1 Tax=Gossypium anomalum TaxID=47600 RepID=A0A8J6CUT7_9ROSI|nr:hypothetical protein CXB51_018317 [Gossypium anomalum]
MGGTGFELRKKKMGIGRMVVSLKSKLRSLKMTKKKPTATGEHYCYYDKMEKTESMRVEIRSRKARKLIQDTLKIADSTHTRTFHF